MSRRTKKWLIIGAAALAILMIVAIVVVMLSGALSNVCPCNL